MQPKNRVLKIWLSVVLASLMAGCSSGAHSTASRPTDASNLIYLAQITCWDTESCCIQRDPLTAAERCAASAAKIAEVASTARSLHEMTQAEAARLEEEAHQQEDAEASDEPPNCKGQNHHVISRPIAKALKDHETLGGLYTPRDERFVAKAKDKESHCGYQDWHRKVDQEVIKWLEDNIMATPEQFMKMLREIYNRPDMLKRFPNGF